MRLKKVLFIFLSFFIFLPELFSLSISYSDRNPLQGFDSELLLRAYGYAGVEWENFSKRGYLHPSKGEIPSQVYVHFAGTGGEIYSKFGHTGIVLEYADGQRIFFDWGVFDSSGKDFRDNFIHGNLYYYMSVHSIDSWLSFLRSEGRTSRLYKLKISPEKKKDIQDFLLLNARDENVYYLYDFFKDNCSTRLRDLLDKVLDGKLREKLSKVKVGSFRSCIERAIRFSPIVEFLFNLGQGSGQDETISFYDAMFLPEFLELGLLEMEVVNEYDESEALRKFESYSMKGVESLRGAYETSVIKNPFAKEGKYLVREKLLTLVDKEDYEIKFPKSVEKDKMLKADARYVYLITVFFLVLNLLVFYLSNTKLGLILLKFSALFSFLLEFILGILSIICLYASFFTIHKYFYYNYNLIFINPLYFISAFVFLVFIFIRDKERIEKFKTCVKRMQLFFSVLDLAVLFMKLFYRQDNLYLIVTNLIYNLSVIFAYSKFEKRKFFSTVFLFYKYKINAFCDSLKNLRRKYS